MATVKVKFRPSTVADRPGSIIIIVTNHRVVRQITTGYKVFPCEWDEKQSQLVSTVENGRMGCHQINYTKAVLGRGEIAWNHGETRQPATRLFYR
jgi:hypothetical protein